MKRLFSFKTLRILFAAVIIIFFLYKCPFEYIIGIPCPGCGMTRAFIALLKLDFAEAFYFHPLFPIVIIVLIFAVLDYLKIFAFSRKFKDIATIVIPLIFIAVYFIRMFSGSPIVQLDFAGSLIGKAFNFVKSLI